MKQSDADERKSWHGISGSHLHYAIATTIDNLRQKGIPLSHFLPQTLGGEFHNVWSLGMERAQGVRGRYDLPYSDRIEMNRKPVWDFIKANNCKNILEIGLGDGLNLEKMMELAAPDCEFYSFDNLWFDFTRRAYEKLKGNKNIHFYIGDSRKTLPAVVGELPKMDLIFIDGGHTENVVGSDWEFCSRLMHHQTVCFFHDYPLSTGVRKVVNGIGNGFSVDILRPGAGSLLARVRVNA